MIALVGVIAVALAAWFAINATDEALSDEAGAAMTLAPAPAPSETNGFLDFLVLDAPASAPTLKLAVERLHRFANQQGGEKAELQGGHRLDKRLPSCHAATKSCVDAVAGRPDLRALIEAHGAFLQRYRAMREKPDFIELFIPGPQDALPAFQPLLQGQRLSFLLAAVEFDAGERSAAIGELEKESSFHRRYAAGSRTLVSKMVSYALLDGDALFAADLARRIAPTETALWSQLQALMRPLTKDEIDVLPSLRSEVGMVARGLSDLRRSYPPSEDSAPWLRMLGMGLYRPHQTINRYVAETSAFLALGSVPPEQFTNAAIRARANQQAMEPGSLAALVFNPIGNALLPAPDFSNYIARMHAFAGVQSAVRLQMKLRAAGISRPEEVSAAVSGPLGLAHPDPFTGRPMRFDPKTNSIGFDVPPKYITGAARSLVVENGRFALPL